MRDSTSDDSSAYDHNLNFVHVQAVYGMPRIETKRHPGAVTVGPNVPLESNRF